MQSADHLERKDLGGLQYFEVPRLEDALHWALGTIAVLALAYSSLWSPHSLRGYR